MLLNCFSSLNCQQNTFESIRKIDSLRSFKLDFYQTNIDTTQIDDKLLFWQFNFLSKFKSEDKIYNSILSKNFKEVKSLVGKVYYNINLGDYYFHKFLDKDYLAFNYYKKALELSKENNNSLLICQSLKKILNYYENIIHVDDQNYQIYLDEYKEKAYDDLEKVFFDYYYLVLTFKNKSQDIKYFEVSKALKILDFFTENKLYYFEGKIKRQLGIFYDLSGQFKTSLKYYESALESFYKINYNIANERRMICLINQGTVFYTQKEYDKSIKLLNKAKQPKLNKLYTKNEWYLYYWLSRNYSEIEDFKKSYEYLQKSTLVFDSLNQYAHTLKIAEFETKYQTEKKEKQILIEQQEKKRNRNLFYVTSILLILGGTIAYLNLKNSRKKRLLAEQQKELEKQKNLTLIKEQEIHSINAMIDGQEKERIRIAEDLHDNIGSVLATLKLHFENLKLNREKKHFNQEELYNKTEKLIDETYLKVRSIAHAKNAGVIANQGLLVAIKIMAEKISAANQIKIYVVDYGLDNRLENSIEITVFRIIQELTTNIIKHANASEATINISQFDNSLNIIIEDDGKGFDVENTTFKSGIGIASIQKRIQHLQGTFQIDSTLEKGTSIIINMPIMNT